MDLSVHHTSEGTDKVSEEGVVQEWLDNSKITLKFLQEEQFQVYPVKPLPWMWRTGLCKDQSYSAENLGCCVLWTWFPREAWGGPSIFPAELQGPSGQRKLSHFLVPETTSWVAPPEEVLLENPGSLCLKQVNNMHILLEARSWKKKTTSDVVGTYDVSPILNMCWAVTFLVAYRFK